MSSDPQTVTEAPLRFALVGDNPARPFGMDAATRARVLAANAGFEPVDVAEAAEGDALIADLDFAWDPLWLKELAPSTELRKWFGHDPARWEEFQARYREELREKKDALALLMEKSKGRTVTLVYGARDEEHNEALVLKRILEHRQK